MPPVILPSSLGFSALLSTAQNSFGLRKHLYPFGSGFRLQLIYLGNVMKIKTVVFPVHDFCYFMLLGPALARLRLPLEHYAVPPVFDDVPLCPSEAFLFLQSLYPVRCVLRGRAAPARRIETLNRK